MFTKIAFQKKKRNRKEGLDLSISEVSLISGKKNLRALFLLYKKEI